MGKLRDAVTNLSAVTTTGAGSSIEASDADGATVQITAASVTSGGTVLVQGSLDGSNWATLSTTAVSASGTTGVSVTGRWAYLRTNVSARTDGTYTTKVALWESCC